MGTRSIRFEYQRPGKGASVYLERLVVDRPDAQVLLLEPYDGDDLELDGQVALQHGAPIVWFVFPELWFTIGRFHRVDGTFTGWYGNLCTPVRMDENHWASTDLFLDLWMPVKGPALWLDEDEFAEAEASKVIDRWTAQKVRHERARIDGLLAAGQWPPAVTQVVDLAIIRTRLQQSDAS